MNSQLDVIMIEMPYIYVHLKYVELTWNAAFKSVRELRYQIVVDSIFHGSQNHNRPCIFGDDSLNFFV